MARLTQPGQIIIKLLRQLKSLLLLRFKGFNFRLHLGDLFSLGVQLRLLLDQAVFFLKQQCLVLVVEFVDSLDVGLLPLVSLLLLLTLDDLLHVATPLFDCNRVLVERSELLFLVLRPKSEFLELQGQLLHLHFQALHLLALALLAFCLLQRLKAVLVSAPQTLVLVPKLAQLLPVCFDLVFCLHHELVGLISAEYVLDPFYFLPHLFKLPLLGAHLFCLRREDFIVFSDFSWLFAFELSSLQLDTTNLVNVGLDDLDDVETLGLEPAVVHLDIFDVLLADLVAVVWPLRLVPLELGQLYLPADDFHRWHRHGVVLAAHACVCPSLFISVPH